MIHARSDYNRIQDPENLIPEDEPVFLLRAKDKTSPQIVRLWASAQRQNPKADFRMIKLAEQWADKMEAYGFENGNQWPDVPNEVLKKVAD